MTSASPPAPPSIRVGREEYEEIEGGLVKQGGFGTVRPVTRKSDGKKLACKCISFEQERYRTLEIFKERVEKEISLLKAMDHPNIIRYYDMKWEKDDEAKIYTEYLEDQNLKYHISQNYKRQAELAVRARGVEPHLMLEEKSWTQILQRDIKPDNEEKPWTRILHRDIKPDNVLVHHKSSGDVVFKLCDFGLGVVRSPEDTKPLSFGGTPGFIPPEVTEDNPDWSNKADIFALGCTLYYVYKRKPPWSYQLTNASSTPVPSFPEHTPESIKVLIYTCIAFNAQNRPEAAKLFRDALEHLDEKDRALASIETFHTISDTRPRILTPQSSGLPGSAAAPRASSHSIQDGGAGSLPKPDAGSSVARSSPQLETVSKDLASESPVLESRVLPTPESAMQYAGPLELAPLSLWRNKDFVTEAVKQRGSALQFASPRLRGDRDVVLEAVKQDGLALEHASTALKADRDVVLEAVWGQGSALQFASPDLQGDKEIVIEAVKQQGLALQYAARGRGLLNRAGRGKSLHMDKHVVSAAVKRDGGALQFASRALRDDKKIVLDAVKQRGSALKFASPHLQGDREVVLEAVKQDGSALKYASHVREDKEFVLEAVSQHGSALKYASQVLREDKEVVLKAVKQDGLALEYASTALQADGEVIVEAVEQNASALQFASSARQGGNDVITRVLDG